MAAPDGLLDLVLLESKILFKNMNNIRWYCPIMGIALKKR
jgi:hypothetical protein